MPLPLPPGVEHMVLKSAFGVPEPLRREVFGIPPHIDGQDLAEEMQILRRLAAMTGEDSISGEGALPVAAARARLRKLALAAAGPPLPMTRVESVLFPGAARPLTARLYVGLNPLPAPRPLLLYFHGGGGVVGDLDTHDGVCRFLATHSGAMVASIDYRLAPEHPFPAATEDAVAAFRWAVLKASLLKIDPKRIAVGGDSAGANLATVTCFVLIHGEPGPKPAMQVLLYPVTDAVGQHASRDTFATGFLLTKADVKWCEDHCLPPGVDRSDPKVSPLQAPVPYLAGLPPAYVATAGFDPLRDEGNAYARKMKEAKVDVTLRPHDGLIHSFANLTALSPVALGAMHEVAGAIRAGLTRYP
jgi:acetyl esterase